MAKTTLTIGTTVAVVLGVVAKSGAGLDDLLAEAVTSSGSNTSTDSNTQTTSDSNTTSNTGGLTIESTDSRTISATAKSGAGLDDLLAEAVTSSGSNTSTDSNTQTTSDSNTSSNTGGLTIESTDSRTISATAKSGGNFDSFLNDLFDSANKNGIKINSLKMEAEDNEECDCDMTLDEMMDCYCERKKQLGEINKLQDNIDEVIDSMFSSELKTANKVNMLNLKEGFLLDLCLIAESLLKIAKEEQNKKAITFLEREVSMIQKIVDDIEKLIEKMTGDNK